VGCDWTTLWKILTETVSYSGHKACLDKYYTNFPAPYPCITRLPPISLLVTPKINLVFVACRALITVDHQGQLHPQERVTFGGLPEAKSHILRLQPSSAASAITNMNTKNANKTMMTAKVS